VTATESVARAPRESVTVSVKVWIPSPSVIEKLAWFETTLPSW